MKIILSTFFALSFLSFAQETSEPKEEGEKKAKPQFVTELEALTKEQQNKYMVHFREADRLFKQKRIFECLNEIHEVHRINSTNPGSLNLEGACYVEFRNFKKARAAFKKALKQNPENFNVRFNLAEIDFVTSKYAKSLEQLNGLKEEAKEKNNLKGMAALVDFKILLCKLKTGDEEGAKKILEGTDFLDDTPLFYYGNAALEYFADRGPEAEVWLARAGRIFRNPSTVAPWQDTLIEFGYIKSFYGGDLEVETLSPTGGNGK